MPGLTARDELAVAALLHDVGRLVLAELYGGFELDDRRRHARGADPPRAARARHRPRAGRRGAGPPLGHVAERRGWRSSATIRRRRTGHAAAIRLADLVVHHASGEPGPAGGDAPCARDALGLDRDRLAPLLYEFPHAGAPRRRPSDPCPLSAREIDALRGLAEGKVYKQIAQELSLSVSTIRTHLHNVYRKIGAVDRAQAVLIARDRGWI